MKHNVKRLCSLLLALVLALSLLPTLSVPVSALYLEDTSLQCTWTLQDNMPLSDGTTGLKLTIRPTNGDSGRMDYYAYLSENWVSTVPWASYIPQIEEVELTEGVLNAGGNLMSYFRHENTGVCIYQKSAPLTVKWSFPSRITLIMVRPVLRTTSLPAPS